jgi:DNA-binding protein YbaB
MTENWTDAESWKNEVSSTPPVIARSQDGAVEVEVSVDLEVRRVTLEPRATRDLDVLESTLLEVVNDALRQAREANPINRRMQSMFGDGQADLQQKLGELQDELKQRSTEAEMYFADIKRRVEQRRGAMRNKRP